jgi:hypothetical protein
MEGLMPEFEMKASAIAGRLAVQEALEDLGAMSDADVGPDGSHTTDARANQVGYWGKRGATRKRLAEVEFLLGDDHWRATLQEARVDYFKGLQLGGYRDHWLLGQYVVLGSVLDAATEHAAAVAKAAPKRRGTLRQARPNGRESKRGSMDHRKWQETCGAVRLGLESDDPQERMWAWSSLADLRLVARRERLDMGEFPRGPGPVHDLEEMVEVVGGLDQCDAVWPTFRQFWRWHYWWYDPTWASAARDGYEYLRGLVMPRLLERMDDGSPTK